MPANIEMPKAFFERKPAPDMIRGGRRFASRKRVIGELGLTARAHRRQRQVRYLLEDALTLDDIVTGTSLYRCFELERPKLAQVERVPSAAATRRVSRARHYPFRGIAGGWTTRLKRRESLLLVHGRISRSIR
jgi:hypothetical protein